MLIFYKCVCVCVYVSVRACVRAHTSSNLRFRCLDGQYIQMERRPTSFPIELGGQILQTVDTTNIFFWEVLENSQFLSNQKSLVL